jgi:hypothetical protein
VKSSVAEPLNFYATPAPTLEDTRAIFLNNKSKHKGWENFSSGFFYESNFYFSEWEEDLTNCYSL